MNKIKTVFTLSLIIGHITTIFGMKKVIETKPSVTNTIKQQFNKLSQNNKNKSEYLYKKYESLKPVFEHPLYAKFFEPIYVGNKSDIWGKQVFHPIKTMNSYLNYAQEAKDDFLNFNAKVAHKMFHLTHYQTWKFLLTDEELLANIDKINSYEQAYNDYIMNPADEASSEKLLHEIQILYGIQTTYPLSEIIYLKFEE